MRPIVTTVLIASFLCACSPSTPQSAAPVPAKPADSMKASPAAPPPAAPPAEAAAPPKEIPEGACGDQSKLPAADRVANTARWTTASEQNNFGFDVLRGDTEKGEFKKITKDPILGAGTSDETHKYEFHDDNIDPCKEYWYYVEGISTNGTHEKFSPVFRAPPKHRPVGSPATPAPAQH
ncbi:MAG: hypothetical protein ABIR62_06360 [Dokdonella sp.]|uniref:hypothetical protein n=1 Tax=Dokdonella sp. TaxID=2291710 RepID=UPI0032630524